MEEKENIDTNTENIYNKNKNELIEKKDDNSINPVDLQRLADEFVDYASNGDINNLKNIFYSEKQVLNIKRDTTGLTALHAASEYGYEEICKFLLNNDCDINSRVKVFNKILFR